VKVSLDTPEIALGVSEGLRRLIDGVAAGNDELDPDALEMIARAAEVAARMRSPVDLWFAQNASFRLLQRLPGLHERAADGDARAIRIVGNLQRLAGALRLAVPA
ncbi:MAG: hypothetical protein H0T42_10245, partial [Deltaproteobacteria bacterium]|nr:hypothetical protein [Deltaproteobacteria bacterium]